MIPAVDGQKGPKNGVALLLLVGAILFAWRLWILPRLGITLYVDEAQYWTWAQEPAWGYFSKPPGIAALIWLSTALFGDGLLGVKMLALLCYPATAAACWAIARHLYDERTAFWTALVVLSVPMYAWLGLFVSTDALLTLFWSLALLAFLRARASDRWRDWLLLGTLCGLGLLSKYTMAAWLGAAFLYLLVFERARLASAKPWVAALLALAILSPNIAWNVANDFPTLKHTADITVNKRTAGGLAPLAEFWGAQWAAFGPVFGSIFLLLLVQARSTWRDQRGRLLLWFALPLWAVVSAQALKSGANANWAAPAFAPAAIAVVAWLLARNRQRLLIGGLVVNVLLVGVAYHWPTIIAAVNPENPAKKDPYTRARGWDELARQLRPLLQAHPDAVLLADNRTLLAHLRYELRDRQPVAVAWNPQHVASDHYKLTTDLNRHRGGDALLVTERPPTAEVGMHFRGMEKLADLHAPLDANTARRAEVYLLHDFQGY